MKPIYLLPLILAACAQPCATVTPAQIEDCLKRPAAEQRDCICERPTSGLSRDNGDHRPAAHRPEPPVKEPPVKEPPKEEPGKEPNRETDPDGWGHWREER